MKSNSLINVDRSSDDRKSTKKDKKEEQLHQIKNSEKLKNSKKVQSSSSSATHSKMGNEEELIQEVKYLDKELNLLNDHQESEDEERFNFSGNTHYHIKYAFSNVKPEKNKWEQKLLEFLIKRKIFENISDFNKYISQKQFKRRGFFKYSLDQNDEVDSSGSFDSSILPKFLILLDLIFLISYMYQFQFDLGYKKFLLTLYNLVVFNYGKLSNTGFLFSLTETEAKILSYFVIGKIRIICMIIFIILNKRYEIERTIENFTFIYKLKKKNILEDGTESTYSPTLLENSIFSFFLVAVTYLYIPIIRDSISIIIFCIDNTTSPDTSDLFFVTDSSNIYRWVNYITSCVMGLICLGFPLYLLNLMNNSYPLLDPFDSNNDTIFHTINCPDYCTGSILDLDKRMCWDFVKDDLFVADIFRPVSQYEYEKKEKRTLKKYYSTCNSKTSPLLIYFQGFSYYFKNTLFINYMKHLIFLILIKVPFSTFLPDFGLNDRLSIVSFSLGTFVCLVEFCLCFKNFRKKFNFLTDTILELIVRLLILIIAIMSLLKIGIEGNLVFENNSTNKAFLATCEIISFTCLCLCIFTMLLFIVIFSLGLNSSFRKKKFLFNTSLYNFDSQEMKIYLLEKLWKPFWNNLFYNDSNILSKEIKINDDFKKEYLIDNDVPEEVVKMIVKTPLNRIKQLKKKIIKNVEDFNIIPDSERFEKISISEILIRKWLQHRLEGVDVYWDGDVIGKRTCSLNYFGRLIIDEYPFKTFMIYDETNEKVEIPQSEWLSLCKMNLQNQETLRQKDIRKRLRSLNDQVIEYDENYIQQSKGLEVSEISPLLKNNKHGRRKSFILNNNNNNESKNINKRRFTSKKSISLGLIGLKKDLVKKGKLKIKSIIPEKKFFHGFYISMEIYDEKDPNKVNETINFNTKDISINDRNFKSTKLNTILQMNKALLVDPKLEEFENEKKKNRENIVFKRYLDEITLSSHFIDMIYDNCEVSIMEILKYFVYFERRKEMKVFPYFHINGLIFISHLWTLCSENSIQAFWYCFFYDVWQFNKRILEEMNLGKYFDPDSSLSICYYAMEREKLENFINKLEVYQFFPKRTLDEFYKKIKELKEEIELENKEKLRNLEQEFAKKDNQNKGIVDEEYLNTEKINKLIGRSQDFRDKRSGEIPEYSPVQYVTPTWMYCSLKDENELKKIPAVELERLKKLKEKHFKEKNKNCVKLFSKLGEQISINVSFFTDEDIFDLYYNRNFGVEESYLAQVTTEGINIKTSHSADTKKKLIKKVGMKANAIKEKLMSNEISFEGKQIQITLPSIFKYIDYYKKFEEKTDEIQKIDHKGRVFYVNDRLKNTTFKHPLIPKKVDKKAVIKDEDMIARENKLKNEGWETMYYKHNETGEVYILYVNSLRKDTSWNPTKVSIIKK